MRLLLDEMYPSSIATALRKRGHDVVAVVERRELRGLRDSDVFAVAQDERRTVVTENVADFVPLANELDARGVAHHGVVLVPPAKYRLGDRRTIGALVGALDALLHADPSDAPTSLRSWL